MITLKIKYLLNIKPLLLRKKNNLYSRRLYCRFFFFLFLFFEYYFKKKNIYLTFFFFKEQKRINSILKAPHHYKKAQTKIKKQLYSVHIKIDFNFYNLSLLNIFSYIKFLKVFFFFNSNLFFLHNKQFFIRQLSPLVFFF